MDAESGNARAGRGIGRKLEAAREDRGLSLWDAERETRIRPRYLGALEREEFDVLPAVYVLGSLKTYADFLGLDGAALSAQLKAGLLEPDEHEPSDQPAAVGGRRDDGYGAWPAVGFDQLFLGMGVILISILAVMTLVAAIAQGDDAPVSQIHEPSTPETPSEIALAGNVDDRPDPRPAPTNDPPTPTEGREKVENTPEASKDRAEEKDDGAPQPASVFGDVEFVPMAPASPAPSAPASASPAPATAQPGDASASPVPDDAGMASPGDSSPAASSAPASRPAVSSAPSRRTAAPSAPPRPSVATPATSVRPEATGERFSPQPSSDGDRISARVDARIDEIFAEKGLD